MFRALLPCLLPLVLTGCASSQQAALLYPNPAFVPAADREHVWQQVVDVVDDYFQIEREERVHLVGDLETEGRIDTFPIVGATVLEPWRGDSASAYDRLESTFQTTRRRALVRVVPDQGGYLIDVAVFKEVEDLERADRTTASAALFRNDSSVRRFENPVGGQPATVGWIPLGRDVTLEQQMLAQLQTRLGYPATPVGPQAPQIPQGFAQPEF